MLPQQSWPLISGCCHASDPQPPCPPRRGWEIAAGALSIGVWVFMPKCPACLAAHLALWTGLGLSFAEATYFRWSLLLLSGALPFYLLVKRPCWRWLRCERPDVPTKRANVAGEPSTRDSGR
jgi:hypothetical protein